MKYRILSIDGGGIRGLVAAILLKRISETPGPGWNYFCSSLLLRSMVVEEDSGSYQGGLTNLFPHL